MISSNYETNIKINILGIPYEVVEVDTMFYVEEEIDTDMGDGFVSRDYVMGMQI